MRKLDGKLSIIGMRWLMPIVCVVFVVLAPSSQAQDSRRQAISPGKVRFVQTPGGQWTECAWENGKSLITGGGLIVFADKEGVLTELVNTGKTRLAVPAHAEALGRAQEGMPHGCRAPSLDPDDDRDGRNDEDRLDGVDNDHDGAIDEDFAAIGDEMVVTEYRARDEAGGYTLEFHQEDYAWSLPHLDGVVMLSVRVRNAGDDDINNFRVAAYYERGGYLEVSERTVEITGDNSSSAVGIVSSDGPGASVSLLAFGSALETGGWCSGFAAGTDDVTERVTASVMGRPAAGTETLVRDEFGKLGGVDGGGTVFLVSPPVDVLAPGEEVRVDFALIVSPTRRVVGEAMTQALQTYIGDGKNSYIPPPVSIKPLVLWGSYRIEQDDRGRALSIELDDLMEDAGTLRHISSFTGVDPSLVEKRGASHTNIVLHGQAASELLEKERAILRGRLESGEFFELVLRRTDDAQTASSKKAEAFWKTPGKLEPELLRGSPNPFRKTTSIFYEVPAVIEQEDGSVIRSTGAYDTSVKIYNVSGRLVGVLVDERMTPGTYSTDWTAVDDQGHTVASGVYYLKLQIENRFITKRLILLK